MSKTADYAINQANEIKDGFYYYHAGKEQLKSFDRTYNTEQRLCNLANGIHFLKEAHRLMTEAQSKPVYGGGAVNQCPCQPEHNPSLDPDRV